MSVWDDNGVHTKALILAYDQTCEHDEDESQTQSNGMFGWMKRRH